MYPKFYLNMKSALILDEQSRQKLKLQEHSSMSHLSSPPTQELTLEEISPKWAMRLKGENMPTFMSLTWLRWRYELQKSSKCVVGEAYGYSSHYTEDCDECNRIGYKFLYYFMSNRRKRLELNKQEFVKHWNEEHSQNQRSFLPSNYPVRDPIAV
jgi:hypothetical protein